MSLPKDHDDDDDDDDDDVHAVFPIICKICMSRQSAGSTDSGTHNL